MIEKTKSTAEILSPKPVIWSIGDKEYEQKPLRIDKLSDVLQEVVDTILTSGRANIIDKLLDGNDVQAMAPMLLQILVTIPKKLPKVVALCLDVPKKEIAIRDGLKARQAIEILREFINQNEITELLQDFFGLMGDLGLNQEVAQAPPTKTDMQVALDNLKEKQEAKKETKETKETKEKEPVTV